MIFKINTFKIYIYIILIIIKLNFNYLYINLFISKIYILYFNGTIFNNYIKIIINKQILKNYNKYS